MWAGPAGAPAAAMVDRSRTISRSLSPMPQSQFSIWPMAQDVLVNELLTIWQFSRTTSTENWKSNVAHFEVNTSILCISGCKCRWSNTTVAVGTCHTFAQKIPLEKFFVLSKTTFIDRPATPFGRSLSPSGYGLERFGSWLRWKLTAGLLLWLKAWYPFWNLIGCSDTVATLDCTCLTRTWY